MYSKGVGDIYWNKFRTKVYPVGSYYAITSRCAVHIMSKIFKTLCPSCFKFMSNYFGSLYSFVRVLFLLSTPGSEFCMSTFRNTSIIMSSISRKKYRDGVAGYLYGKKIWLKNNLNQSEGERRGGGVSE